MELITGLCFLGPILIFIMASPSDQFKSIPFEESLLTGKNKEHKDINSSCHMIHEGPLSVESYKCQCRANLMGSCISVTINCSGSGSHTSATKQNYTIFVTILSLNGLLQVALVKKGILALNGTIPIIFNEAIANHTTQVPFEQAPIGAHTELKNTNFWIIIGCQFAVIMMLVAYQLWQRHHGATKPPMYNVPPPTNELSSPNEEVFDLRPILQNPPPPPEAVYEVNPNCSEAPTVRCAQVPIYKDQKFYDYDPCTHQDNEYANTLTEQEHVVDDDIYANISRPTI